MKLIRKNHKDDILLYVAGTAVSWTLTILILAYPLYTGLALISISGGLSIMTFLKLRSRRRSVSS